MNSHNNLLKINQLATVCNTSRSALIRMEKSGILTPVYVDENSGYRYYDQSSVLRVARILSLQEMGFTHKDLYSYFSKETDYQTLLDLFTQKMSIMEFHIANLRPQLRLAEHLSIEEFKFPEMYCYIYKMENVTDYSIVRPMLWKVFDEIIYQGYTYDRRMNPFVIADYSLFTKNNYQNTASDIDICIPVLPTQESPNIQFLPVSNTLSAIMYGGSKDIVLAFQKLQKQFEKDKLTPSDQIRIVSIVQSYPGQEIPPEYWVTRVCLPIV